MRLFSPQSTLTGVQLPSYHLARATRHVRGLAWFKDIQEVVRTHRFASLTFLGVLVFFILSLSLFIFSLPSKSVAAEVLPKVTPAVVPLGSLRNQEIHIAPTGLVLLRAARVVSINGGDLVVSTAWGSVNLQWIVHTNASSYGDHTYGTRLLNRDGQTLSSLRVKVGDLVTITGTLEDSTQEPTLDADTVRTLENS